MTLIGENFPPPTGGMVQSIEPHMLAPHEAQIVVDAVFHFPGELRMRGPWNETLSGFDNNRVGVAGGYGSTGLGYYQPNGFMIVGGVGGIRRWLSIGGAGTLYVGDNFETPNTTVGNILSVTFDVNAYAWSYEQTPAGITLISGAPYDPSTTDPLTLMWAGSARPYNSAINIAGTITTTATSTTVTGVGTSFTTEAPIGSFLFSGTRFIGVVQAVASDTSLTLMDVPYSGALAGVNATSSGIINLIPRIAGGMITTRTTQSAVTGSATNFQQIPAATTWVSLFARSDAGGASTTPSTFVGYSQYVTANDNPLGINTLTYGTTTPVNASSSQDIAYWFGYRQDNSHYTATNPLYKSLMTEYAGRYWYAVKDRLYFSSRNHFADVDMSSSGTWFNIPYSAQNPLVRIVGAKNALLLFYRNNVYAVYGTDVSNFSVQKIEAIESLMGPNTVCRVRDGLAWAGSHGIYLFSSSIENVTARSFGPAFNEFHGVGTPYRRYAHKAFTATDTTMTNATLRFAHDYLFFSLNNAARTQNMIELPASGTPSSVTSWLGRLAKKYIYQPALVVYLPTRAAGIWSNTYIVDSIRENDSDYLLYYRTFNGTVSGSTYLMWAENILNNDQSVYENYPGYDDNMVLIPNGTWPFGFGSVSLPTAESDWCNDAFVDNIYGRFGPWAEGGAMGIYEMRSQFTQAMNGTAPVGTWVADNTFLGGGYLTPTAGAVDIRIANGALPLTGKMCYTIQFKNNTGITMYFRSGGPTSGFRLTVSGGTATMESVTFSSSTSWSVGSVGSTAWTRAGLGTTWVLRLSETFTSTINGAYLAMSGSGLTTEVIHMTWANDVTANLPAPTILTRAFTLANKTMWLRKLRLHGRVTNDSNPTVYVQAVSNDDNWFSTPTTTTNAGQTFNSSSGSEVDNTVFDTRTWFFGDRAQMWQFFISPVNSTVTYRFIWQFATLFYKSLRGGRR